MTRDEKIQLVERLARLGGFAESLGKAMLLADEQNLEKLVVTFPEYFGKLQVLKIK